MDRFNEFETYLFPLSYCEHQIPLCIWHAEGKKLTFCDHCLLISSIIWHTHWRIHNFQSKLNKTIDCKQVLNKIIYWRQVSNNVMNERCSYLWFDHSFPKPCPQTSKSGESFEEANPHTTRILIKGIIIIRRICINLWTPWICFCIH